MKKILLFSLLIIMGLQVKAQYLDPATIATSIGTGVPLSNPKRVPFTWHLLMYYDVSDRFQAGIGSGISIYRATIIPLFFDAKFMLIPRDTFTPFLQCGIGYGFTPEDNVEGGFLWNPSLGIQYAVYGDRSVYFSVGYEHQKLREDIKTALSDGERVGIGVNNNVLTVKMGVTF